jgi:hypothetical protein
MTVAVLATVLAHGAATPRLRSVIVGGAEVNIAAHPYMAQVFAGTSLCGGTVISDRCVLTAQHCVASPARMTVAVGRTKLSGADGQQLRVTKVTANPDGFDAAVLVTDGRMRATAVQLNGDATQEAVGLQAVVAGWGRTGVALPASDNLKAATVSVVASQRFCPANSGLLCAVGPQGNDACFGDSGGPLMVGGKQVGIVHGGPTCGDPRIPSSYTIVRLVKRWVESLPDCWPSPSPSPSPSSSPSPSRSPSTSASPSSPPSASRSPSPVVSRSPPPSASRSRPPTASRSRPPLPSTTRSREPSVPRTTIPTPVRTREPWLVPAQSWTPVLGPEPSGAVDRSDSDSGSEGDTSDRLSASSNSDGGLTSSDGGIDDNSSDGDTDSSDGNTGSSTGSSSSRAGSSDTSSNSDSSSSSDSSTNSDNSHSSSDRSDTSRNDSTGGDGCESALDCATEAEAVMERP